MIITVEEFAKHLRDSTTPSVSYNTDYEPVEDNPDYEPEAKSLAQPTPKIPISSEDLAGQIVNGFNFALSFGFDYYARISVFDTKEEFVRAKRLYHKIQKTDEDVEVSDEEYLLFEKYSVYLELREQRGLDKNEKEKIREPLRKWLGEINIEMHPGLVLLLSIAGILASKIILIHTAKNSLKTE